MQPTRVWWRRSFGDSERLLTEHGVTRAGALAMRYAKVAILVLVPVALLAVAGLADPPPLAFSPASLSFGRVTSIHGQNPVLSVSATNRSKSKVHVSSVSTGCGCISASFPAPTDIEPGRSLTVPVTLRLQDMRLGAQSYELVLWESPEERLGQTTVQYEFDPPVVADKRRLFLNVAQPGASAKDDLTLKVRREGQPRLRALPSTSDVDVVLEPTDAPDSWKLAVTARPTSQPSADGLRSAEVSVLLGDEQEPALLVPVQLRVAEPVSVQPDVILLGPLAPGVEQVRRVGLSLSDGYVLREVRTSTPALTVTPGQDGHERFVEVRVLPTEAGNGTFEESATLVFDGPSRAEKLLTVIGESPVTP
jgi:hypothetical protein